MKTRFALGCLIAFAFASIATSCNKIKDLVKFNIPLQTADVSFTIPAQAAGTQTLASFETGINIDSILKVENTSLSISNIKSVKITSCVITASNANTDNNFGNLSAAQFALASGGNATFTNIAEISGNPTTYAASITIPIKDVELKDYFTSTSVKYKMSGTVVKATTVALQCKATIKFNIEAGL